jgi:O-antigen/teichoic acid export membrane protein
LAGQTMWYGLSSIAARFLNYLMTPYLTAVFTAAIYGEISLLYAAIPLLNILFTYGMETAYFRFYNNYTDKKAVYNTISISLIASTIILTGLLLLFKHPLAQLLNVNKHEDYITIVALIIGFDALAAIPFARLRQLGKPKKYAFIRLMSILINITAVYFFISVCPKWIAESRHGFTSTWYNTAWGVGYVFVANLIASMFTLVFLWKEWLGFDWKFDKNLWKTLMLYSMPLIIAGLGGMINETFDRIMVGKLAPFPTEELRNAQVGIYSACYKLSMLITFSVQAFRMAAEPFFFKQAQDKNAPRTYARVMKFFVVTLCIMFLGVVLFVDVWKYMIGRHSMWVGLPVVPILLLANMFLGIYYSLSIWYKLGNKTKAGATITLIGAAITLLINFIFIPFFSYMASAWATFFCYGSMMVISFVWGQKEYRIPYAWKKLVAFMVIAVLVYWLHNGIDYLLPNKYFNFLSGLLLLAVYCFFIFKVEKKEFAKLPVVGKWVK